MIAPRRVVAVAVLAALWVVGGFALGAGPAAAADGSISNIRYDPSDGKLSFSFLGSEGQGLGNQVDLTTKDPTLSLTASGATTTLQPIVTPADQGPPPTYMLVLDTSGSMQGDKFDQETQKALAFLSIIDQDAKVGLTVFGSPAENRLSPTTNHELVKTEIGKLRASSKNGTDLFSAVKLAADEFPADDSLSMMVMVTDGNDSPAVAKNGAPSPVAVQGTDAQRLRIARKALIDKSIRFVGVIIGASGSTRDLEQVVKGYQAGQVVGGDVADASDVLQQLFDSSKSATDKAVRFTATVPKSASFTGTVTLDATAMDTAGQPVTASTLTLLLSKIQATPSSGTTSARATVVGQGSPINTPILLGALGALFLAMVVLIVNATGAITAGESKESEVTRRLSFYTLGGNRLKPTLVKEEANTKLSESRIARTAINVVNRIARQRKLDKALDTRLEAAGLPIRTAEWTLLHLSSAVGGAILLLIAARGMLLGAIFGLVLGLALPWMFLSFRTSFRERKFLAQLPDTLQLLSGSLAAGYSLPQAMDAVLRESQAPISVEFSRALIETRLGMPPEDALEGIAARTGSKDFSWVVMAIRIQREVGGNLAELLSTVADTLRERERLRRQVSALSAEGRLSGVILGALPLVFALFLIFTKPEYIAPLFEQRIGIMLLITGSVLLLAGSFWMSRLVKVEV